MNRHPIFFVFLTFSMIILSCNEPQATTIQKQDLQSLSKARFKTAYGDILIKFKPKKAPATVSRIKTLISQNFYNGIVFHRVVPNFVIQAGDPTGTGSGGSGLKLKAEFSDLKHKPGTVAMARLGSDINSADSQFYICLGTPSHLDGQYTIFAEVSSGMDVVKKIKKGDKIIKATLEK